MNDRMISVGEIQLHVAEAGSGPPLLLVHGFPLDHQMWQAQLAQLPDNFRLIAPDLRGFGQSSGGAESASMAQFADDLVSLLDALEVQEPVTLCGLSMGGYIAFEFAARHRARLAKLVLCDTRAAADSAEAAEGRRKNAERVLKEGPAFLADSMLPKLFAPSSFAYRAKLVEQTKQVILSTRPEGIAAALLGMATRTDMRERLPHLDVPTLLLCGEQDAITPATEMRQVALAMPHATYVEIPDAGHMSPLEQPAAVNAALVHFLKEPPTRGR